MLSPTWGMGMTSTSASPLRALVTICLWGISVGLRLGFAPGLLGLQIWEQGGLEA